MKILRFLSAALMVISGIWHGILAFQAPENKPMLAFAVIYFIIGLLLFIGNSWGIYLGIIMPLIGIIAASIKIGWNNFDLTMIVLIMMDILVIISCALLLFNLKKPVVHT